MSAAQTLTHGDRRLTVHLVERRAELAIVTLGTLSSSQRTDVPVNAQALRTALNEVVLTQEARSTALPDIEVQPDFHVRHGGYAYGVPCIALGIEGTSFRAPSHELLTAFAMAGLFAD